MHCQCGETFDTPQGLNIHISRWCRKRNQIEADEGGGGGEDLGGLESLGLARRDSHHDDTTEDDMIVDDDDHLDEGDEDEEEEEEGGGPASSDDEEGPAEMMSFSFEGDEDHEEEDEEDEDEASFPGQEEINRIDPTHLKELEFIAICQRLGVGPSGVTLLLSWFSSFGGLMSSFPSTYKALVGRLVPATELSKLQVTTITIAPNAAKILHMDKLPFV